MPQSEDNLIWIDLEMTGLDVDNDHIIEIATVMTDSYLNILAEGPVVAIHQSDDVLNKMDKWNTKHHTESGLVARVRDSQFTVADAEQQTLEFVKQYVPQGISPMCGNTICQDKRFMCREMPALEKYFHYRLLDVSTVKILCQRWAPQIADGAKKESQHLALADIRDSIQELRYYREHFINK